MAGGCDQSPCTSVRVVSLSVESRVYQTSLSERIAGGVYAVCHKGMFTLANVRVYECLYEDQLYRHPINTYNKLTVRVECIIYLQIWTFGKCRWNINHPRHRRTPSK
jgi:hypothetical protein